jgi:putative nucleotidyltransferase with HDIG domain
MKPVPRLPLAGNLFIWGVVAAGLAVAVRAAVVLAGSAVPPQWLVFAALTIATGTVTLKIPAIESRLSVSELFAFSCVLLFGAEAGAIVLAVDGMLLSLRWRFSAQKTLFNFANLALSVWISGKLFFLTSGSDPMFGQSPAYSGLILPLALLTIAYFVINSGLTATAVAFEAGSAPWPIWRQHFAWLAPSYLAGASVSLLLVMAFQQLHLTAITLVPPILLICYLTLRSTFGRVEDARSHVNALNRLYLSTVETLASAIDAKDDVTHSHIRRVQVGAVGLARELGVNDEQMLKAIEAAALLHDTGKLAVPEHILNKPGKLTPVEYERMKLHAPIGAEILSSIEFPYPVVPIVRHHHENWDGTGYPDGLRGSEIPIGARILSVVDCFDALTSDRPYRRALVERDALAIIAERRGTMYDPIVVDTFLRVHGQIMPATDAPHPAARAIGEARARDHAAVESRPAPAPEPAIPGEALAVESLARAMAGQATVSDLGALLWMMLRQILPCQACCLWVPDGADGVVAQYAAGDGVAEVRGVRRPIGSGIAGWVAAARRPALNADPMLDLGDLPARAGLATSLTVPLLHDGALVGVLSVYSSTPFSEDHERLLALLLPRLALAVHAVPPHRAHPSLTPRAEGPRARTAPELRMVRGGAR